VDFASTATSRTLIPERNNTPTLGALDESLAPFILCQNLRGSRHEN
ncbi:unnamed protein product, partial [Acidithrix sp. C25]